MKRIITIFAVSLSLFSSSALFADNPVTQADAARQAKEACAVFGKQATPTTQSQSHGSITYGNATRNDSQNTGARNTYSGTIGASGSAAAGVISGALKGEGNITRQGSQTNTSNQQTSNSGGTLYYKCE